MARRGTELFPDLGAHCDEAHCMQIDFLPFECDGCGGSFCAAHRAYADHGCAKAGDPGRTVVLCPDCGDAVERAAPEQSDRDVLDAHARSRRCDPARKATRRPPPPRCPAPRCREAIMASNATQCKGCGLKVCLKHRFPDDHGCSGSAARAAAEVEAPAPAAGACQGCGAFRGVTRGVRGLYRRVKSSFRPCWAGGA
ncbi:unnamed protein product [Urochloa decumbens]|uniref:AN1-type domain-containing protein n=1 Tax=Urochloa decumbens TaxID=240449 RepID=A0ABC8XTC7_9POAL